MDRSDKARLIGTRPSHDEPLWYIPADMPVMMVCLDIATANIVEANALFSTYVNCQRCKGRSIYDFLREDQYIAAADYVSRLSNPDFHAQPEMLRFRTAEADRLCVIHASRIRNANHAAPMLMWVVVDAQREADRASKLDLYQHIVSYNKEFISFVDKNYIYRIANNTYLEHFGLTSEQIIGHSVSELHKDKAGPLKSMLDRTLAGETVRFEAEINNPSNNSTLHIDSIHSPYYGKDGKVEGVIVSARDISETKHAETWLKQERSRYEALFNSSPDLLAAVNLTTGQIMEANQTMRDTLGDTDGSLIKRTVFDLYSQSDIAPLARLFSTLRATNPRPGQQIIPSVSASLNTLDGELIDTHLRVSLVADNLDTAIFVWRDMRHQNQLSFMAFHDPLTHLLNREGLRDAFQRGKLHFSDDTYLCFCDLDNFKQINDKLSHQQGDKVLKAIAKIFRDQVRGSDIVARLGGDEFVIILPNCGLSVVRDIMDNIIDEVEELRRSLPTKLGNNAPLSVSIGISRFSRQRSLEALLHTADSACYESKRGGKNLVVEAFETGSNTSEAAQSRQQTR